MAIRIPQKLALCYSRHQFSSPFKRDLLYYMMVFCTIIGSQVQSTKSMDVYSEEFPTGLVREDTQQKGTTKHSSEICRRKVCNVQCNCKTNFSNALCKGKTTCATCHIQMLHSRKWMQLWNKSVLPSARGNCLTWYENMDLPTCWQGRVLQGHRLI